MSLKSNIVHQYFKKEIEGSKIMIKVDPIHLKAIEIIVHKSGKKTTREIDLDEQIFEDLEADEFINTGSMEFNLYYNDLVK